MKTQEFLTLLAQHQDKKLLFQYAPNLFAGANYHLTEVKNVTIESVDCGANVDSWKETIVQIWESPKEIGKTEFMGADKALSIMNTVDNMKKMERTSEIKFEYGNAMFHTAQLFVADFFIKENNLILTLASEKTDCKAKELCGVPDDYQAEETTCTPGGGCC